jgi:hypothetical protein
LFDTLTSRTVGAVGGEIQRRDVVESHVAAVATLFPNRHEREVVSAKPLPVTTTLVPPASVPCIGSRATTVGRGSNSYTTPLELPNDEPPSVDNESGTVSRNWLNIPCTGGVTHVIVVGETYVPTVVDKSPKRQTSISVRVRFIAETVTRVPPSIGPRCGDTPTTTAGRMYE